VNTECGRRRKRQEGKCCKELRAKLKLTKKAMVALVTKQIHLPRKQKADLKAQVETQSSG
jgi:hypothetical protein